MPRDKIAAKFSGHPTDMFVNGVPARDIMESEFDALTDEQKVAINASPLYDLRGEEPTASVAAADKHVERAEDAPISTGTVVVPPADPKAPEAAPVSSRTESKPSASSDKAVDAPAGGAKK
jgi:hypothetical protein